MKLAAVLLLIGCSSPALAQAGPHVPAQAVAALPDRLSDADFWALETRISEPGGYFQIEDNFTSNEMEVGELYSMLQATHIHGGVYMGVGPEQNFTYIAAIRPQMAFVVDIRRQAVMQHLMFKAVFELAKDRADFVSLLFSKARPAGIDSTTPIEQIWSAYRVVPTDTALATRNYRRIVDQLTKTQGFTFTDDESAKLRAVYSAFTAYGPSITTRGNPSGRGGDFADLTGYSNDSTGHPRSFLSSEDNYRFVKSLQDRNLIVPVSGDFGGKHAINAIGGYLADHGAKVSAFYVSNVEQYLFMDGKQSIFYANVAGLPVDSMSVFIRPYSMRRGFGGYSGGNPTLSLCPIARFMQAVTRGQVASNNDALACAR
ncbi:MAG TPA: hypothetical protein VGM67_12310 [Gemmatimonadaceae bacterium]|jgi:hypothetical protein